MDKKRNKTSIEPASYMSLPSYTMEGDLTPQQIKDLVKAGYEVTVDDKVYTPDGEGKTLEGITVRGSKPLKKEKKTPKDMDLVQSYINHFFSNWLKEMESPVAQYMSDGGTVPATHVMLPPVEITAKKKTKSSYSPNIDESRSTRHDKELDDDSREELRKLRNELKEFLYETAIETRLDQLDRWPGALWKGSQVWQELQESLDETPLQGPTPVLLEALKIPGGPHIDALINAVQNNPWYNTRDLDRDIIKQSGKAFDYLYNFLENRKKNKPVPTPTDKPVKKDGSLPWYGPQGGKVRQYSDNYIDGNTVPATHVMLPEHTVTGSSYIPPEETISEYKPKKLGRKIWEALVAPASTFDRFADTTYDDPSGLDMALSIVNPFAWIDGSINLAGSTKNIVTGQGDFNDYLDVGLSAILARLGLRGKKLKGAGKNIRDVASEMFNPFAGLRPATMSSLEEAERRMRPYVPYLNSADQGLLYDHLTRVNNENDNYLLSTLGRADWPSNLVELNQAVANLSTTETVNFLNRFLPIIENMTDNERANVTIAGLLSRGQQGQTSRFSNLINQTNQNIKGLLTQAEDFVMGHKQEDKKIKTLTGPSKYDLLKSRNIPKEEKNKIKKMSVEEIEQSYLTPKQTLLPRRFGKEPLHDVKDMSMSDYEDAFNSNLARLNEIIASPNSNTSGVPYTVTGLKNGQLMFDSPLGPSSFTVDVRPGKFTGDVKEVADYEYIRTLPGINMSNTTKSVFGDGRERRGTKTYESINKYLKEMELGRVKSGLNSQTKSSLGLWSNVVKKDKAYGYYPNDRVVYAIMKSLLPPALLLELSTLQEENNIQQQSDR